MKEMKSLENRGTLLKELLKKLIVLKEDFSRSLDHYCQLVYFYQNCIYTISQKSFDTI